MALTFEANQTNEGLDPQLEIEATGSMTSKATNDLVMATCRTEVTGRARDDDEGHARLTSHRTTGELTPCQQGHHDWHCSITPYHAAT
jgi:hypothetical protein